MWSTKTIRTYEDGPTRLRIGLARTIYIRCVYGIFGREITKYTVKYGVHIRFWPTLCIYFVACKVNTASSAQGQKVYLLCCLQCKYSLFSTGTSPHMRSNMAYTLKRFRQETLPAQGHHHTCAHALQYGVYTYTILARNTTCTHAAVYTYKCMVLANPTLPYCTYITAPLALWFINWFFKTSHWCTVQYGTYTRFWQEPLPAHMPPCSTSHWCTVQYGTYTRFWQETLPAHMPPCSTSHWCTVQYGTYTRFWQETLPAHMPPRSTSHWCTVQYGT